MTCLCLLGFVHASFAQSIREVRVDGAAYTDEQTVRDLITVRAGDDLSSPAVQQRIRDDVRAIFALGYYSDVYTAPELDASGAVFTYHVQEKPRITDIRFEGNEKYKRNRLLRELGLEDEWRLMFFDDRQAQSLVDTLREFYITQAFPNVSISWSAEDGAEPNTRSLVMTIDEGEKRPVEEIEFIGNQVLSDKLLKDRIETKESWWFIIKNEYNEEIAKLDALRLQRAYWDYGYLDAQVELLPVEPYDGGLKVSFEIDEGEPYTLGAIELSGNTLFSDEQLLDKIESKPGDRFEAGRLQQQEIEMLNLYREQGYLDVSAPALPEQIVKDEENKVANLNVVIREAPRKYLGQVDIQGVITLDDGTVVPTQEGEFKTKDFVVTREIELVEGEPIDWTQVLESDRNLVNTGFFKSNPFPQRGQLNLVPGFERVPTSDPNIENLLLRLEEEQTGSLSFGGGVSTTYGPSVFATLSENNLFGYGVRGSVTGEFGEFRTRAILSFFEPYLLGSDISLDWDIFWIDTRGFGGRRFDEERIGTTFLFSKEITDEFEFLFGFKIEDTDLSPESGTRFDLDPVTIPDVFNIGKNLTTSVTVGFDYDTRDFRLDPTDGIFARSTVEIAGLADNEFIKQRNEFNYYKQLFERTVLAASTQFEWGFAYGDPDFLPLQERFFVGGSRTVRGFEEGGIGQSERVFFKDPVLGSFRTFLGGEAAHVNNLEMRYRFSEVVQGVAFFDVGTSWPELGDIDPSEYRMSTGLGIRIKIPFVNALIRFDFPFVLRKFDDDDTEIFHFSFGQTF